MKSIFVFFAVALVLGGTGISAAESESKPADQVKLPEVIFDEEVVELFSTLPVLDQGRIKPLDTVARFRLLSYHGKQSMKVEGNPIFGDRKKLTAMEWMLLTWFRPEVAKELPLFVVDNSEAVVEIGVPAKGPRDRYSYNEVFPAINALMQKMQEVGTIEAKQRTPSQRYVAKLGVDFFDYTMMVGHFDFARAPFGDAEVAKTVPVELVPTGSKMPRILEFTPKMQEYIRARPELVDETAAPQPWLQQFSKTLMTAEMSRNPEQTLRIFPPSSGEVEVWQSPGGVIKASFQDGSVVGAPQVTEFKLWEDLYYLVDDAAAFKAKLKELHQGVTQAAAARGEGTWVNTEVSYHQRDYMTNSLVFFILGLLSLALSWAAPTGGWGRWCVRLCWLWMLIGSALVTTGIVIRCLIMQRPPVATLYETILFITATGVIAALIAEAMSRRKGIALLTAALCGTVGMFLSIRYMNMEGTDTLQQLQAVLLTNFWLATHVPIINLGYSAGMVSAILSMIYFVGRLVGYVKRSSETGKDLTRIAYGFVMAGLFLSLVGTILGGIWANYSWGRFWGWDPKENGALLIVLMNLIILHARMGGYIREIGFHACSILLGMIVIFSWFGTNQLGVGLHAYGFTDGIWFWLSMFWASQLVFLAIALVLKLMERASSKKA
ncbi:hypothetical protein FEM03_13220 [Phragmitibacter flavus]|uniref:Cytochrome c assembly protein domain-containing protein n=1 Tax=Phragmitibacter flavus TaxID=2576071 RepID=A0A5R8KEX9_9BACT|nr:cytochrome c biogenesis protein CcsA [Phragmitibacter flavus]TLD70149.1 hypothetical protein FEM03_13220 [Phragmitibacter flavus]